ncbi:lysophospholipid acyltransferase family protein [Kribbella sp. NPDC055071]
MWYWLFKHVLAGPALRLIGRPSIEGLEHIPRHGPAILAGNHLALADSLYLCLLVRRRVTFVAKSEFFDGRGVKGRVRCWFFTATGQVPITRSGGRAARSALDAASAILNAGGLWGIYPEGSRSRDGRLYRGKTGAMRVALATGAPVIPVIVHGTDQVNPPDSRRWHFGRVHITICPPLDLAPYVGQRITQQVVRQATDHLMSVVQQHSGQEYLDIYSPRVA